VSSKRSAANIKSGNTPSAKAAAASTQTELTFLTEKLLHV